MYRVQSVQIGEDHPLFAYCVNVTEGINDIYNVALFYERQMMSSSRKSEDKFFPNESLVRDTVKEYQAILKGKKYNYDESKGWILNYCFLEKVLRGTQNDAFFNELVPRQTAQHTVREVTNKCFEFLESLNKYMSDSSGYTGRPKAPNYLKSGSRHTAILTNQACKYRESDESISLPKTKERLMVGELKGRIKEVRIVPFFGVFKIEVVEQMGDEKRVQVDNGRYMAIDLGVNNFAAITNNFGERPMLFKGGVVKSLNQKYNKTLASLMSSQTKGTDDKFVATPEFYEVCKKRYNSFSDFFHKLALAIVDVATTWNVSAIAVGENKGWKQKVRMRNKDSKQNFAYVPFDRFKQILKYLCEERGIMVVFNEESYTSKASYLDSDEIPVYGEADHPKFSGRRTTRGNYKASNGCIINADLNGSANIGRKAFGSFENVCFDDCLVLKHPDIVRAEINRENQKANCKISKSKLKRDRRKLKRVGKSNPYWIGFCE